MRWPQYLKKKSLWVFLYGRAWQPQTLAKAYKNRDLQAELANRAISPQTNAADGGQYSFNETVRIDVFYETLESIRAKQAYYLSQPIGGTAYWRIGQEPGDFYFSL